MNDIKEEYRQETKGRVYSEEFEITSYTDEYVRWLEQKIANNTEIIGGVTQWVAVDDRLPNHGEKVLTYTPDSDDSFQLQRVITFGAIPSGFPSGVTHWMHLPAPPCTQQLDK